MSYCANCGQAVSQEGRFCAGCGHRAAAGETPVRHVPIPVETGEESAANAPTELTRGIHRGGPAIASLDPAPPVSDTSVRVDEEQRTPASGQRTTVERSSPGAGMFCHRCGTRIATASTFCSSCGVTVGLPPSEIRDDGKPADKVGAGRYILSFVLAGFLGLWIQYWARNYGWRGVTINAVIFTVVIVLFLIASAGAEGCYDEYGNYTC